MAKPNLPRDAFGESIQALALGATVTLIAGPTSVRAAVNEEEFVARIACTNDCYLQFGDGSVVADGNSPFFPKGAEIFKIPTGVTHVAVIQHTTGGTVSITTME
jgi:hypothetical protein